MPAPSKSSVSLALTLWLVAGALACRPATPAATPTPGPSNAPAAQESVEHGAASGRSLPEKDASDPATAVGIHGAVTSAERHASEVGVAILKKGGNAVDAAVAVGLALAVTHPSAGNLGGGGFMVIRMADGRTAAIDYREVAPAAATPTMYLDAKGNPTRESVEGPKAAGIPGTVAGLALAHEQFGSLPWRDLVLPAVALARDGHELDSFHAEDLTTGSERMLKLGYKDAAAIYRRPSGETFVTGDVWKQPDLARTLETIADQGPRAFYEGPLADKLAREVKALGGIWSADDLKAYRAVAREPITFKYRDHDVITMPPPSGGGVVLRQLLAAREILKIYEKPWLSVDELHLYVESARRTYADRNFLLGDPAFVKIPLAQLTDPSYLQSRLADIDPNKATPSSKIAAGIGTKTSMQTTHYSVVDVLGNAVANTYTLNTGFGAKVVVPGTGVLLNNEMDDFSVKPGSPNTFGLVQGEQNKIEPGKRMLSSMSPTILVKDGKLRAVVGTPGGSTISTTVTQIVRALIDYGATIDQAVKAPRVHHQWMPDRIVTEPTLDPATVEGLKAKGHTIAEWPSIGHANSIEVDPKTQGYRAVADIARDGGAAVAY
ncbi:gamma-glutamyltransferase [Nannocystis sp. RBIL2]|uniref:gamma-glutamyltransferase n=1 Tax=Nannocystis sp. RBIL2 TaxID=2996788 RepID=UPI002270A9A9|nr:gamma-glutamyltransferase [Nannocystis sp. RBIL2]MCY1063418.1 gamma-glutamyltransferase [Nannocystis sp. RBIL2]